MLCPIDGIELTTSQHQGVQVDHCPVCRGVWLDRGELDKIINAAYAVPPGAAPTGDPTSAPPVTGVWADSIQQAPAPAPQVDAGQLNVVPIMLPGLGGLFAGLSADQGAGQGQRRNRRPRGWLEEIFDIDIR